jgi:hypothetical protein
MSNHKIEIFFLYLVMSNTQLCFMMAPRAYNNNGVFEDTDNNINIIANDSGVIRPKDCVKGLPNKYAKLMHFGFWLLSNVAISNNEMEDVLDKLYLYANVETQADFFENFYAEEKEIAKSLRKFSAEKIKELKKSEKETGPKGRDQILRDAFIDNLISKFNRTQCNTNMIPIL